MRFKSRKLWTEDELALLAKMYPHKPIYEIAVELKRPIPSVSKKGREIGLERAPTYLSPRTGRRGNIRPAIEFYGDLIYENLELWKSVQKTRAIARNNPNPLWRKHSPGTPNELASQVPVI